MDHRQRQLAFLRFMEIEVELQALAESRVVDGDPATVEGGVAEGAAYETVCFELDD